MSDRTTRTHARTEKPPRNGEYKLSDLDAARVVLAVASTRKAPPPEVAKQLDPEWGDACFWAEEHGPDSLGDWLKVQRSRLRADPARFEALASALEAARADPEQVPAEAPRSRPPPFSLDLIDSRSFFSEEYRLDWLVKGVLVAGETGTIGGPSKSLKTSILIDLAISLGTATPFLGKFTVPRPVRVGLISGESGRRVIQSNARQVCRARELPIDDVGNVLWGFKLPQLSNAEHLAVLRKTIEDNGLECVCIDPFYLTLMAGNAGVDPSNMFSMGPILNEVAIACREADCTPIIAHHFTKKRDDPFGPPELTDLAYAGIGQFIRQWMLVAPRERFDAEIGFFKLFFYFGGSAGHCGEYAVNIEVGKLDPDVDRRTWKVEVCTPSEERVIRQEVKQAEQERKAEEKRREQEAKRDREDCDAIAEVVTALRSEPGCKATVKRIRDVLGWRADKAGRILARMEKSGSIRSAMVPVVMGGERSKEFPGFALVVGAEGVL